MGARGRSTRRRDDNATRRRDMMALRIASRWVDTLIRTRDIQSEDLGELAFCRLADMLMSLPENQVQNYLTERERHRIDESVPSTNNSNED